MATKITDNLRSFNTVETPEIKASRAKRFHVVYTGDCGAAFAFGYDTPEEAVAATEKKGSGIVIWDTETNRRHARSHHHNFAWWPAFPTV